MPAAKLKETLDRNFTWRVARLDARLAEFRTTVGSARVDSPGLQAAIPVMMIVDVEPDGFFIARDSRRPWRGYEAIHEFFRALRPAWSAKTGAPVHYSWYFRMDPQIAEVYGSPTWAAKNYAKFIDEYVARGDELGLHPHDYRWDIALDSWIVDHGNQSWINYCVQTAFAAYREAFGRNCDSFRFGDRWMNDETIALVEAFGARFDLTLEPGRAAAPASFPDKPFTGSLPDYADVPRAAYRRSRSDYRKPDPGRTDGIWMIPLSTVIADETSALMRLWGKVIGDEAPACAYRTLNLADDPAFLLRAIDRALQSNQSPYLAFVIRSDIGVNESLFENLQKNLAGIMAHRLASRFILCTPAECMKILGLIESSDRPAVN